MHRKFNWPSFNTTYEGTHKTGGDDNSQLAKARNSNGASKKDFQISPYCKRQSFKNKTNES